MRATSPTASGRRRRGNTSCGRRTDGEARRRPNGDAAGRPIATVIAETATEISRLSVGEAVMRMDLADQPVLMFRNSATGELNVVYRRSDGNIGWIDPARSQVAPGRSGRKAALPPPRGRGRPVGTGSVHQRRQHLVLQDRADRGLELGATAIGVPSAAWMAKPGAPLNITGFT